MCGEIDENSLIGQEILERLTVMSGMLGVKAVDVGGPAPDALASAEGRAAYMEQIFRAGLTRALSDSTSVESEDAVDAVAAQAIAFGRLAGFMAGQLPPEADLFRSVVEAVTAGYAETARLAERHAKQHADPHGHPHDHHH